MLTWGKEPCLTYYWYVLHIQPILGTSSSNCPFKYPGNPYCAPVIYYRQCALSCALSAPQKKIINSPAATSSLCVHKLLMARILNSSSALCHVGPVDLCPLSGGENRFPLNSRGQQVESILTTCMLTRIQPPTCCQVTHCILGTDNDLEM